MDSTASIQSIQREILPHNKSNSSMTTKIPSNKVTTETTHTRQSLTMETS